jgi:hypothetical protein
MQIILAPRIDAQHRATRAEKPLKGDVQGARGADAAELLRLDESPEEGDQYLAATGLNVRNVMQVAMTAAIGGGHRQEQSPLSVRGAAGEPGTDETGLIVATGERR